MGRSFTNSHIFNASGLTKAQFKKAFTDMMKAKGYVKATEDDAALSFSLIFSSDRKWVTVLGEDINAADLAKSLDLQVLSVELVDSDFAELKLHTSDGWSDILMLGRPYIDEYPVPTPDKWQTVLGENTWSQVEEIQSGDYTFAEDALAEFGTLIGLGENILIENDDIPNGAEVLHFKKAAEKKLTLNAAFKQYFGSELEKQGFVRIKSKYPYYVRLISDEILHIISYRDLRSGDPDYGMFTILGGVATVYRKALNLSASQNSNIGWLKKMSDFLVSEADRYKMRMLSQAEMNERRLLSQFAYKNGDEVSLQNAVEYSYECAEKYLLSQMNRVMTLDDCISWFKRFQLPMVLFDEQEMFGNNNPNNDHNEGLLYVKVRDIETIKKKYESQLSTIKQNIPRFYTMEDYDRKMKKTLLVQQLDEYSPDMFSEIENELKRRKDNKLIELKKLGVL